MGAANRSERPEMFSFWKPEPLPAKDGSIQPVELLSFGELASVAEHLLEVPRMTLIPRGPWAPASVQTLGLRWHVDEGVVLQVHAEQGPPLPGEVLTINARTLAPLKLFYRLYVQIFEQFGAMVLDEQSHQFVTPREFREKMN